MEPKRFQMNIGGFVNDHEPAGDSPPIMKKSVTFHNVF